MLCNTLGYRDDALSSRSYESNERDPKIKRCATVCTMPCADEQSGCGHRLWSPGSLVS